MRCLTIIAAVILTAGTAVADPMPSWNDGPSKQKIIDFVEATTRNGGPDFISSSKRIAVFDNDGTLWAEQPIYFQLAFAFDRIKAMAPQHPEWKETQPFKAVLENDVKALAASGKRGLTELIMTTHAGMTAEEFESVVLDWVATAKHPKTGRLYTEMIYQPMLELLDYLRANGFKTYIVSGGGIDFMRPWAERIYGIPPEQVIGSSVKVEYKDSADGSQLMRLPEVNFIDDKAGKPVGIHYYIGRRPVAAFGNSDGDFEMLEWVTSGNGARLGAFVHHDDAEREVAYDRDSHIGRLDRGLDEAPKRDWSLISMKNEWKCVFRYQCAGIATSK